MFTRLFMDIDIATDGLGVTLTGGVTTDVDLIPFGLVRHETTSDSRISRDVERGADAGAQELHPQDVDSLLEDMDEFDWEKTSLEVEFDLLYCEYSGSEGWREEKEKDDERLNGSNMLEGCLE